MCFECGRTFHLNPRSDVEGIDCGDAWIGESLGVTTYCSKCIERLQQQALAEEGANAELARGRGMMEALTPGLPPMPATSPPPSAPPREAARAHESLPPRSKRVTGRRYRRIDQ
jgi:hypothetical protein